MAVEAKVKYPHIDFDENDNPMIHGTTMKVIALVVEKLAYGWSPEELYFQHPYLTLGQIHAALAFYWDHADELDKEIAKRLEKVEDLSKQAKYRQAHQQVKFKTNNLL